MKSSELRIGNYVYGLSLDHKQKELDKISSTTIYGWETNSGKSGIEPIPLTEEWLLKLAFKKNAISYSIDTGKVFLKISENEPELFYAMASQVDDIVSLRDDLKFVHELQNLFFALTGEELQLKSES